MRGISSPMNISLSLCKQTVLEGRIIFKYVYFSSKMATHVHIETRDIKRSTEVAVKLRTNAQLQWGVSTERATDILKGIKVEHRGERSGAKCRQYCWIPGTH